MDAFDVFDDMSKCKLIQDKQVSAEHVQEIQIEKFAVENEALFFIHVTYKALN